MAAPVQVSPDILNSWKEIANHIGRGVRTVQRWEALGLPVRRPRGPSRGPVFALSHEVDAWVRAIPTKHQNGLGQSMAIPSSLRESMERAAKLRGQCQQLRAGHFQAMRALCHLVSAVAEQLERRPLAGLDAPAATLHLSGAKVPVEQT